MGKSNLRGMSLNLLTININLLVIEVLGKMTKLNKHLSFLLPRAVCRHISSLLPKHLCFFYMCVFTFLLTRPLSASSCVLSHISPSMSPHVCTFVHISSFVSCPQQLSLFLIHISAERPQAPLIGLSFGAQCVISSHFSAVWNRYRAFHYPLPQRAPLQLLPTITLTFMPSQCVKKFKKNFICVVSKHQ